MNIAFDAKRAFTNGTGLGHYSRTLISSLAEYFPSNEYFLFTPNVTSLFDVSKFENVHIVTPERFPSSFLKSAWRSNWVKNDLLRFNIGLYHGLSHEIPLGINKTKIKSVVTIHDLIFERYPQQYNLIDVHIYRAKFKYACDNADKVIAISQQTKDDIIQFYKTPQEKISICYQSCNSSFSIEVSDADKQRIKSFYHLPEKYFLYVGSLIERKNLLTICKALKKLQGTLDIPLVVIGDGGKYKEEVKKYTTENNLTNDVIFLSEKFSNTSFKDATDFPGIYQQAVAMIYPSTFEGFGIPVLEALCSRLPTITSNVSCMPETGGDAALYINPYDESEMSNAMQRVARDENLRATMIDKGIKHAQYFTQQQCASAVMDVYKSLL